MLGGGEFKRHHAWDNQCDKRADQIFRRDNAPTALAALPHEANCERVFSYSGRVHSDLRLSMRPWVLCLCDTVLCKYGRKIRTFSPAEVYDEHRKLGLTTEKPHSQRREAIEEARRLRLERCRDSGDQDNSCVLDLDPEAEDSDPENEQPAFCPSESYWRRINRGSYLLVDK